MKVSNSLGVFAQYIQAYALMKRFKSRDALEEWQQKRLKVFFDQILSRSPFYKAYSYDDFQNIPVISRHEMLENFDQINTAGLCKKEALDVALKAEQTRDFLPELQGYTIGLSSGTSGQRGIFVASPSERKKWAGIMLAKTLEGRIWQSQKVALLLRANSNLYESLGAGNHIRFQYYDITQGIDSHLSSLNEYQPSILTGPASILKHLAQQQATGALSIQPRQILSGAEVLDPQDQAFIESIFKVKVRQIYQCTEGFLGMTSLNGELLLNEEYVLIEKEYIDEAKARFVPIITDFTRTTQPIVRYRLDDVLVEDVSHSGVYTALAAIEGRCDDIFYFRSLAEKRVPIYADVLRQTMVASGVAYEDYQITQRSENTVDLKIKPALTSDERLKLINAFGGLCRRMDCHGINLIILPYDLTPGANKLRRIHRQWDVKESKAA